METKMREAVARAMSWGARHGKDSAGYQNNLRDVAVMIAEAVPLAGGCATDDECEGRGALVREVLDALGVGGGRAWWTVVAEARPGETVPPFGGVWAHSREEALLECFVWRPELRSRHIAQTVVELGEPPIYNGLRRAAEREARRAELDSTAVTLW